MRYKHLFKYSRRFLIGRSMLSPPQKRNEDSREATHDRVDAIAMLSSKSLRREMKVGPL